MVEPGDSGEGISSCSASSDADSFLNDQSSSVTIEEELSAELAELLRLCDRDAREQQSMHASCNHSHPQHHPPCQRGTQPASHGPHQHFPYPASLRQQSDRLEHKKLDIRQSSPHAVRLLHAAAPCMSEERRRQPRPKRRALKSPSVRRSLKASFDAAARQQSRTIAAHYNPLYSPWQSSRDASPCAVAEQQSVFSPRYSKSVLGANTQWSRTTEPAASQIVNQAAALLADMHAHGRVHGNVYSQALHMLTESGPPASIPAHIPSCLDSRSG